MVADVPRCTLVDGEFVKVPGARENAQQDGDSAGLILTVGGAESSVHFASPRPTPPPSRGQGRHEIVSDRGPRPELALTTVSRILTHTRHTQKAPTTLREACDCSALQNTAGRELQMEVSLRTIFDEPSNVKSPRWR